jgi:small-conductance mechanosensitive channel
MRDSFLHNDAHAFAIALAITLSVLLLALALRRFALARLEKLAATTPTLVDDVAVHALKSVRWYGWLAFALWLGARVLTLSRDETHGLRAAFVVVVALQIGVTLQSCISFMVLVQQKRAGRPGAATTMAAVGAVSRLVIFAVLAVLVLSNLGIEVSALAATLGIGGLAAALAVQNVLGDLFASLSIYLDRPFDLGDSIQVDGLSGEVESISWRSTYVRSAGGEQIVFANSDLGRARIRNFRRLAERRVVIAFRLPLDTSTDALEALPGELAALFETRKDVRFERAHLVDIADAGLAYELVFWIERPALAELLDRKQAVIIALRRTLDARGIPLATSIRALPHETTATAA